MTDPTAAVQAQLEASKARDIDGFCKRLVEICVISDLNAPAGAQGRLDVACEIDGA